jgi:hypothetical protein
MPDETGTVLVVASATPVASGGERAGSFLAEFEKTSP